MATPLKRGPIQDLPPPGGYPGLDLNRRLPGPRMSGAAMFLAVGGMMSFGFYKVIESNTERRELKKEKREMRAALIPFLQAEEDARFVQRRNEVKEREVLIMGEGWEGAKSPYSTPGVWTPPADNRVG